MILDPVNDEACLGQLTELARELAQGTVARRMAKHLGSRRAVVEYFQSLPQSDDDGREALQYVSCDVRQRMRVFPLDPNCFERTLGALVLLEILDPAIRRLAVTIDAPARHTGVVERLGDRWRALDVFPGRDVYPWVTFGKILRSGGPMRPSRDVSAQDVFGVLHPIGKGILGIFGAGSIADQLGKVEQDAGLLAKDPPTTTTTQPQPTQPTQPASAKPTSPTPPSLAPAVVPAQTTNKGESTYAPENQNAFGWPPT